MTSNTKQVYHFTDEQLTKAGASDTPPGARQAWDHYLAMRGRGGNPVCYYSSFNGFDVLDANQPDTVTLQRLLRLEQASKPFRG